MEIPGMRDLGCRGLALWVGVGLTPENFPLAMTCYHAKFGHSAAMSPQEE